MLYICILIFSCLCLLQCGDGDDTESCAMEEGWAPVGNFVVEGAPAGITAEVATARCIEEGIE